MELIKKIFRTPSEFCNKNVKISGWIRTIRDSKSFGFVEINDGSFFKNLQIVIDEKDVTNFQEILKLSIGSAVTVEGELLETPGAKQPFELKAKIVTIEGISANDYPLQKKKHTFEFLRTIAHLRPRTNTFSAVFRVRSVASYAIHKFFQDRGFVYVQTPIITTSDCEGAGQMFKVTTLDLDNVPKNENKKIDYTKDFFGKETGLTVSGQLAGEAYAMAFKNIYTFGPTFRAENSNTARHAAEFWMIEPEISFADLNNDMALAEDMIKFIINYVLESCPEEMKFFDDFIDNSVLDRLNNIVSSKFGVITYTEAIEILKKESTTFEYPVEWGIDLQTEHERYLTETIFKKPLFVINYPKEIKAFYMRQNDDGKTVAAMDLLVPGVGEIIGGSQREERIDILEKKLSDFNLKKEDYWWYLDLRKYGGVKHCGFGLGFERMIMYLTGMTNIRDVISFPRTTKQADF